jgi:two-component system, LytTR family, response regulator
MIRTLIADDELPARRKLRRLLTREGDFEVVAEAADGVQAVEAIRGVKPDVVFLDIQMPRLDGFGVIAEVGVEAMPLVVFVTAFDQHALRAFEVHALDYLLKPFAPSRFEQLAGRLRRQHAGASAGMGPAPDAGSPDAQPGGGDLAARIEHLLAAVRPATEYPRQILMERDPDRQILVAPGEIDLVRAEGNYLRVHTARGEFRRRGTLQDMETRLDPSQFLRINRSELVRLDAIGELQPWFHGDARVVLRNGTVLTWSRRYRSRNPHLF